MSTSLSNSREIVDRSLYESIRLELVDKGYLPNIKGKTEFNIIAIDQLNNKITVLGNAVSKYSNLRQFEILDSTGNNGNYIVSGTPVFNTPNTEIIVTSALPDNTADGKVSIYTYYDDSTGKNEYNTAIQNIISVKGFCIELFNVSNSQNKGLKKVPRIVILSNQSLPGSLGGSPDKFYTPNNGDILNPDYFITSNMPSETTDFSYDICLISNSAKQSRILHSIVALAMPKRGYIPFYNDPSKKFFINQFSYRSIPDTIEGIDEDIYMYQVNDIFETEDTIISTSIKPIDEIKVNTNEGTEDKSTPFNDLIID